MSLPVGVGHHPSFIFVTQNGCLSRCLFIAHSDAVRTAISFHHSDAPFCYDWFSSPQLRLCRSLATPTLAARSVRRARSLVSLLSLLCLASFTKWGSPGHTGWCRGMISGARDQARAPPKTTHCHAVLVVIIACNCSFCSRFHNSLPRAFGAAQYFLSLPLIFAARLWRGPIFCSRLI